MTYLYDRNRICYVDVKLTDQPNLVIPPFALASPPQNTKPPATLKSTDTASLLHLRWFGPSLVRCRHTRHQAAERAILVQINLSGSSRKVGLTFRGRQLERVKTDPRGLRPPPTPLPQCRLSIGVDDQGLLPLPWPQSPAIRPPHDQQPNFASQTRLADLPFTNEYRRGLTLTVNSTCSFIPPCPPPPPAALFPPPPAAFALPPRCAMVALLAGCSVFLNSLDCGSVLRFCSGFLFGLQTQR